MSMTHNKLAVSVADLSVRDRSRERTIIDRVSFEVAQGEFVSLVGPSGSGKSTTVLSLLGLLRRPLEPVSGTGLLAGYPIKVTDLSTIAGLRGRRAAMIFQDPFASLNPVLRCGTQAEEPLRIHTSLGARRRRERVLELFAEVGFDDPVRTYDSLPSELSGGQIQRVMIAMAVALEPAVLLADEPTTALDPATEHAIIELLRRLRRRVGMAVVLITHDPDLARSASDRTLLMREGRIVSQDELDRDRGAEFVAEGHAPQLGKPDGEVLMSARAVSKTFARQGYFKGGDRHVHALEGVSLDIRRGEIVGVVGPSGSGKTTLGRCLAGLESPDAGIIRLGDTPIRAPHGIGRLSPVQVIYQSPYASLNPVIHVGEAIEEGLRSRGVPRRDRREYIVRLLTQVGLSADFLDRLPKELSGGERQRVVIARALAADPKVLIADEPTASLDERSGAIILELLVRLSRDLGLGVLLISHDQKAIARAADRVERLEDGRLVDGAASTAP